MFRLLPLRMCRFDHPNFLACDGHGRVFVEAGTSIRLVRQPPSWRAYGSGGGYGYGGFDHYGMAGGATGSGWGAAADSRRASGAASADPGSAAAAAGAAGGGGAGAAAGAGAAGRGEDDGADPNLDPEMEEVLVSTLPFEAPSTIKGLAYVCQAGGGGPAGGGGGAGAGGGGGGGGGGGAAGGPLGWQHANGLGGGGAHERRASLDAVAGAAAAGAAAAGGTPPYHQRGGQQRQQPQPQQASLVFATRTALYRLPLPDSLTGELNVAMAGRGGGGAGGGGGGGAVGVRGDGAGAAAAAAVAVVDGDGAGGGGGEAAPALPLPILLFQRLAPLPPQQQQPQQRWGLGAVLLAGHEHEQGAVDGPGSAARFHDIWGIAADAAGNIYIVDRDEDAGSSAVRVYNPREGLVSTLVVGLDGRHGRPAILPNGYLALCGGEMVQVLDLGIAPPRPRSAGAEGGERGGGGYGRAGGGGWGGHLQPPPRSLPADLGALLDAQPDGTADLTIRVGERRFHCHRAILSARCDYFKQRLADGAFADAAASELELPDADADAFALLLRWLYTGGADVPSDQARGVAELADRLLLPELCAAAQAVVAASVTAGTVVDCLLWAWGCCESRGPGGFGQLLGDLKGWYLEHHDEVLRVADASLERLSAESPRLMVELMRGLSRSAKRARLTR